MSSNNSQMFTHIFDRPTLLFSKTTTYLPLQQPARERNSTPSTVNVLVLFIGIIPVIQIAKSPTGAER
uniref:hypothetical protein n=1 Tax=Vibrio anguillarum TaxID=55601 RepID=UPI001BE3E813